MNFTYEFTQNEGPKVKINKLEGLKRKINIFIGTKNIFWWHQQLNWIKKLHHTSKEINEVKIQHHKNDNKNGR